MNIFASSLLVVAVAVLAGGDAWVAGNPGGWGWNSGGWGWNTGWWGPGLGVTFGWPVATTWPTTVVGSWTSVPVAVDACSCANTSETPCWVEPPAGSGAFIGGAADAPVARGAGPIDSVAGGAGRWLVEGAAVLAPGPGNWPRREIPELPRTPPPELPPGPASDREWRSEASCAEPRIHSGRWSIHGDRR